MSTLVELNEQGLLSAEDKNTLQELAKDTANILVIGNDEELNGQILTSILRERINQFEQGWYFSSRKDIDLNSFFPGLTKLFTNTVKSYLDVRNIVSFMTNTPIIIDEINSKAIGAFFYECCVGLRNRVTAAYTGSGDAIQCLNSFSQLIKEDKGFLTDEHLLNMVRNTIEVFIIYSELEGQTKIDIIDNRKSKE